MFFFSSRKRHTRCALVTGVQTCALPILPNTKLFGLEMAKLQFLWVGIAAVTIGRNPNGVAFLISERVRKLLALSPRASAGIPEPVEPIEEVTIGKASWTERERQYV